MSHLRKCFHPSLTSPVPCDSKQTPSSLSLMTTLRALDPQPHPTLISKIQTILGEESGPWILETR